MKASGDPITVTLDTNVLDERELPAILEAAQGLPIELAHTTVSDRELEGSDISVPPAEVSETLVWGESRYGEGIWGGDGESDLWEKILRIVSQGTFPKSSLRENLTEG